MLIISVSHTYMILNALIIFYSCFLSYVSTRTNFSKVYYINVYPKGIIAFDEWNASLILLRDYVELVALCTVIVWKTHIPVRTQK